MELGMKYLKAIFHFFLGKVNRISTAEITKGCIFVQVQAQLNAHISQLFFISCFYPVAS